LVAATPRTRLCWLAIWLLVAVPGSSRAWDSEPSYLPDVRFHLTARPWVPVNVPTSDLVRQLDEAVHALAPLQYWNEGNPADVRNGAILDPYNGRKEVQYATPLFAFNVATLLSQGRAADLLKTGIRALDRATLNISTGPANDHHGEFFAAPMVKALRIYESLQKKYPEITARPTSVTPHRCLHRL